MKRGTIILIAILFVSIILISGCVEEEPDTFELNFYIEETNESLDGNVYLNNYDGFLGATDNGMLVVLLEDIWPGTIIFNGTYKNVSFEFQGGLTKGDLNYTAKDFTVSQEELEETVQQYQEWLEQERFNASELDLKKIERQTFDLANAERRSLRKLRWDDEIADAAREHSQDMLEREYFSHKTPEGKDACDRLKEAQVFHIVCNENQIMFFVNSSTDLAEVAVDEWLESPGHRANLLDIDELYSDAGVGIACAKDLCYVTMDFVAAYIEMEGTLKSDWFWFVPLYDGGWGYTQKIDVSVKINSTETLKMYVVPNDKQFDKAVRRKSFDKIDEERTNLFEKRITVEPGYGFLLHNKCRKVANITIVFDYSGQSGDLGFTGGAIMTGKASQSLPEESPFLE